MILKYIGEGASAYVFVTRPHLADPSAAQGGYVELPGKHLSDTDLDALGVTVGQALATNLYEIDPPPAPPQPSGDTPADDVAALKPAPTKAGRSAKELIENDAS
jgi:hypothetical protein